MPLYIVATPIGNLKDITYRAVETLEQCDVVLAEDTRHTGMLLQHYNLKKRMLSYRDQNHERVFPQILEMLKSNLYIALVSDAGTPTISDPGYKLVRDCVANGINVIPIPGAFAGVVALSASGLPTDRFVFLGFLPKTEGKRENILSQFKDSEASLILYESPQRLTKSLQSIYKALGDRTVTIANDLTKLFEKISTEKVSVILEKLDSNSSTGKSAKKTQPLKGEFVIIIGKE